MKGRSKLLGLLVAVMLPGSAFAQYEGIDVSNDGSSTTESPRARGDAPAFTRGTSKRLTTAGNLEMTGSGSIAIGSAAGDVAFTFGIQPFIGYFVTDNFELGFKPQFMLTVLNGSAETAMNIAINPHYNFDIDEFFIPYVGAEIGLARGTFNRSLNLDYTFGGVFGLGLGVEGGVKIPVGNAGILKVAGQYQTGVYFEGAPDQHIFNVSVGGGLYF